MASLSMEQQNTKRAIMKLDADDGVFEVDLAELAEKGFVIRSGASTRVIVQLNSDDGDEVDLAELAEKGSLIGSGASSESSQMEAVHEAESLHHRLDRANAHFRRKACEVLSDKDAVELLAYMYQVIIKDVVDFDFGQYGLPLARLTAAHFCEVGPHMIYITESGQRFIDSLRNA